MRVIMRGDDLGFSEAVNYGIIKSIKDGLITTVGLMPNMIESSIHGANLIKDYPEICLGQHTNICLGKPISDPNKIPSLVNENGEFLSSSVYRTSKEDFVNFEEVVLEIEAQLKKYIELIGKKPEYLEGHAVESKNFFKALEYVANNHNILYIPLDIKTLRGINVRQCGFPKVKNGNYDVKSHVKDQIESTRKDEVLHLIFHPGYIDEFVMTYSSFNLLRCREVQLLCSKELRNYFQEKEVEIISYRDL